MGAEIISTKPKSNTLKIVKDNTFGGLGSLIKLLPTGTIFLFQFLNPLLTNYGQCSSNTNTNTTTLLLLICGIACTFSCFTDSYFGVDGQIHYGIATSSGIWPGKASGMADLSVFKLRASDFVQATFSALVFGSLAFTDYNIVECFYDKSYRKEDKTIRMLMILPAVVGLVSSFIFSILPSKRHGVGYPSDEYPEVRE